MQRAIKSRHELKGISDRCLIGTFYAFKNAKLSYNSDKVSLAPVSARK